MKYVSLVVALALHVTGLWSHTSPNLRARLSSSTIAAPAVYQTSPNVPLETASPAPLALESGTSAFAVDPTSGQILYSLNADKPRPIASVTKLMTVMVALDSLKPSQIVTVGKLPDYDPADETMGLKTGERISVESLVKAALIPSDNDAADALGLAASGTLPKFYAAMNAKANQWGIAGAHFVSASGLIDTGNVVSAAGVAKIAELDLTNPLVRGLVATSQTTITDADGRTFNLATTNDLLATGDFYGIKTGYTEAAGECFVGLTKIDGHGIVTVVLGSSDRFGETQTLVNWIGSNWTWQ